MKVNHLLSCLIAATLMAPASAGLAASEEPQATAAHAAHHVSGPLPEAVREATERFQDVNDAIAAGYVQNGGCVSGPNEGAMGVHFLKVAHVDDKLEVENPEVLVYELRRGRLQLVAAEYVTPVAAWSASHAPGDQPHLMGHLLHHVPGPNRYGPDAFYEIHVWAWKGNDHGAFADWNPAVSCANWGGSN
jgi:hypothetical protein